MRSVSLCCTCRAKSFSGIRPASTKPPQFVVVVDLVFKRTLTSPHTSAMCSRVHGTSGFIIRRPRMTTGLPGIACSSTNSRKVRSSACLTGTGVVLSARPSTPPGVRSMSSASAFLIMSTKVFAIPSWINSYSLTVFCVKAPGIWDSCDTLACTRLLYTSSISLLNRRHLPACARSSRSFAASKMDSPWHEAIAAFISATPSTMDLRSSRSATDNEST